MLEDDGEVGTYGAVGQAQAILYLLVGAALAQQLQHLKLAGCQGVVLIIGSGFGGGIVEMDATGQDGVEGRHDGRRILTFGDKARGAEMPGPLPGGAVVAAGDHHPRRQGIQAGAGLQGIETRTVGEGDVDENAVEHLAGGQELHGIGDCRNRRYAERRPLPLAGRHEPATKQGMVVDQQDVGHSGRAYRDAKELCYNAYF